MPHSVTVEHEGFSVTIASDEIGNAPGLDEAIERCAEALLGFGFVMTKQEIIQALREEVAERSATTEEEKEEA